AGGLTAENRSRAITVVNVAINGHGTLDFALALHAANRDRDIMDHAEAFTVVREGMMKSAADVECHTVPQRQLSRPNRSSGRQPERIHQFRRIWKLHLHFFFRR